MSVQGAGKFYLGVDGGQSCTKALIGDESGRVLGEGRAGPCNHVATEESRNRFRSAVGGAIAAAVEAAGLPPSIIFEAACLGLSGGPADKDALTRELVQARKYEITNDALIALTGATAGAPGVIVIAGTGSIAYGKNAAGKIARAGGWGYVFGDEGGAFDIVKQALRSALRMEEGWGENTALRGALLGATGALSMNDLLHRFYTPEFPRAKIAGYAKLVDQTAVQGDAVAQEILKSAAQALAILLAAVARQLFQPAETVQASFVGGVFESDILRERLALLVALDGGMELRPKAYGPAAGALIEAYRLDGLAVLLLQAHNASGDEVSR